MMKKLILLIKSVVLLSSKMGKNSISVQNAFNKFKNSKNIKKYTPFPKKIIAFMIIITIQSVNCLNQNYQ
jgi:hypothetical protein